MAVGRGVGYKESDEHVPNPVDVDARSADPDDALEVEHQQHPAHVTGNMDTTGTTAGEMNPLADLPSAGNAAAVPAMSYTPPSAEAEIEGEVDPDKVEAHVEKTQEILDEAAQKIADDAAKAGIEEDVSVTADETPPSGTGDGATGEAKAIEDMTVEELKDELRNADPPVHGFSTMNRDDLRKEVKKARKS